MHIYVSEIPMGYSRKKQTGGVEDIEFLGVSKKYNVEYPGIN